MQKRNWIFTKISASNCFTRHCHKLLLNHSLHYVVDAQYKHCADVNLGAVESKEMQINIYIFQISMLLFRHFLFLKIPLEQHMGQFHVSFTERCKPLSVSKDSCFVLCEIDIYATSHPKWDICRYIWILLQQSSRSI